MKRLASLVAAVCLALSASAAFAQAGSNTQISYEALMHAPAGSWAEYTTTIKGQSQPIKMRYALVEKSAQRIAIEVNGQTPMGAVLMRMEYAPAGPGAWKLARARMKIGAQPAADVPLPPEVPVLKKGVSLGPVVGHASIKTPVGTFDCRQYHKSVSQGPMTLNFDLWMNDKVLPVGLVKQADSDGRMNVLLSATGTGAVSQMK